MSKDMPIQGGSSQAPKLEKLQKKQEKKFEKASARQLYKNISKGKVENEEIVTKSFGNRTIEVLKGKVETKIKNIQGKEEKRSTPRKKVTHAFQRVKNLVLAGKFKNNIQLLQMAKDKLPEIKKKPVEPPGGPLPDPLAKEEPPEIKKPVEPAEELIPAQPIEDSSPPEAVKEEPEKEPVKKGPEKKVVKVARKKITTQQAVIKKIDELAFGESEKVSVILKDKGSSLIKKTAIKGEYEVHYRKKDNSLVSGRLIVLESGQMSLQFGNKSPMSIANVSVLLRTIARQNPGPLIGPPLQEGGPYRKFVPQHAE